MALERARLTWPPDEFSFLSPDGDDWLEVSADSYHRAPDHAEDAVAQLRAMLAGEVTRGGKSRTLPMRFARRWLQVQGHVEDRSVVFD